MPDHVTFLLAGLQGGGAERSIVTLANAFAERQMKVDLVLARASGPFLSNVSPSVDVIELKAKRNAFSLPGFIGYLRRASPKAVISAIDDMNFIALLGARLANSDTRTIVTIRSTLSQSFKGSKNWRGRYVAPLLTSRFYRRADAVVAVSGGVADDLAENFDLPRENIEVIYNPVVTPELIEDSKAPLDHPWFAEGEPPVILGVGRLITAKNFPSLIRAFAAIRKRSPARLMILGEGPERSSLEALVQELGIDDDVALPGFAKNPFSYMRQAGLFVLSSRWEGLPGVLIQALACGCPVVSTDCPSGPREILEGGRFGLLVPPEDDQALSDAILKALASPVDREMLLKRANCFDVDSAATSYLSLVNAHVQ
ncbi:MAG: glycosyltransferase [Geminicoccaceae bacterium]